MNREAVVCSLVMAASAGVIGYALSRTPAEPKPIPHPTCAWPAKLCSNQPPRIERWTLADVRAARWGGR